MSAGMKPNIELRVRELVAGYHDVIYRRTDRIFAGLPVP